MEITTIYNALLASGFTRSQMEFSRIWLGRSPRYYSHLIAVKREPGLATLCAIFWRLKQMRFDEYPVLLELQQQLANHIELRSIRSSRSRRLPPQGRV